MHITHADYIPTNQKINETTTKTPAATRTRTDCIQLMCDYFVCDCTEWQISGASSAD
jgi:hypothetical protein